MLALCMQSNYFYEFGPFRFNPVKGVLLRDREPVRQFPPRSSELLQVLIENRDRIVPRDEIMTKIWGISVTVSNSALDYQISSLRDSLGDDAENPQYIKTFRRRGIKFVGSVEIVLDDSQQAFYERPNAPQSSVGEQHVEPRQTAPSNGNQSRFTVKNLTGRLLSVFALSILAIACIVILIYARQRSSVAPQITTLAITSVARPKQEFTVQLEGLGFQPEIVQVVLVGPGCKRFGPCTVPNDVLLDYGQVSKNKIERVPLTLQAGEFKLYVQNGKESSPSNPWPLNVPDQ
jgi:DNA-binding winged helix-turn-helix (wHTH) protein